MKRHIEGEKIALLAGGDLDAQKVPGLTEHLAECPACLARLQRYRESREAMSALRDSGIEASDFDAVRQSVLARIQGKQAVRLEPFAWRRFGALQWGALAAVILIAAVIGTWRWRSAPEPQVSAPGPRAGTAEAAKKPAVQQVAKETMASKVGKRPQAPSRSATIDPSLQGARARNSLVVPEPQPPALDDVVIKLETSDPNVIIIWLASQKGAAR